MATLFQKTPQTEMTGEQESYRRKEASELLRKFQSLLMESGSPALDVISEALTKFEELSLQTSRQTNLDPELRKTLEDISAMLLSSRQMAKNKGIADRLQKIAEDSQKALRTMKPNVGAPQEMSKDLFEFINTWRPVFYLLTSSKDFRILILDSIRIARRAIYGYTDTLSDEHAQKWVQGEQPKEVAQSLKEELKQRGAPELSDEEWEKIQDDLQRVLATLSREPTFREGMDRLFNLLDIFQRNLLVDQPTNAATGVPIPRNIHAQRVIGETEDLISSFSGRDTLELFKFHLGNLVRQARQDERFHSYLFELKQFILKAKSEQEIRSEAFKQQSKQLARRGRELFREFKEDDFRPFLDSANLLVEKYQK
jgi:hypothetical protein